MQGQEEEQKISRFLRKKQKLTPQQKQKLKEEKEHDKNLNKYLLQEGPLNKKTINSSLSTFHSRYIVFGFEGFLLFYYANEKKPGFNDQPKGWMLLMNCDIIEDKSVNSSITNNKQFVISKNRLKQKKQNKEWLLECNDEQDKRQWVDALRFCKQHSHDQYQNNPNNRQILDSLIEMDNKGNRLENFDNQDILKQIQLRNEERNDKINEDWEKEDRKVLQSLRLQDFIDTHPELVDYIHYGFLYRDQEQAIQITQAENYWFFLVCEFPINENEEEDEDDDGNDLLDIFDKTIEDSDIPPSMEINKIYIFKITDEGSGGNTLYKSKIIDTLKLEDIAKVDQPKYEKHGSHLKEFGTDLRKGLKKTVGGFINIFSSILMLDRLIGLKINLEDLNYKFELEYKDSYNEEGVNKWFDKITIMKELIKEKNFRKEEKIKQKLLRLSLQNNVQFEKESENEKDDHFNNDGFDNIGASDDDMYNNDKFQILIQEVLEVKIILAQQDVVEDTLSFFNPRNLQRKLVDNTKLMFKNLKNTINRNKHMLMVNRNFILIYKEKKITRVPYQYAIFDYIFSIKEDEQNKKKIEVYYGINPSNPNCFKIYYDSEEQKNTWFHLLNSIKQDKNMNMTLNELFPKNQILVYIVKNKLFGLRSCSEVIAEEMKSGKHKNDSDENADTDDLSTQATISRSSSAYSKYYYYLNLQQRKDVILDVQQRQGQSQKKQKSEKIKSDQKTSNCFSRFLQKIFPCFFYRKVKRNSNKKQQKPLKQPLILDNSQEINIQTKQEENQKETDIEENKQY